MAILKDLIVQSAARILGAVYGNSFVKAGGTASQFLKADGSVDNNAYSTSDHSHDLKDLGDVQTTNLISGQSIVYDGNTSTFINDFGLAGSIPYGRCDSTSTSTKFTATVPGITELKDGVCLLLKNGVVTSAAGFTININGLGAKPVYSSLAAASRVETVFNSAYTALLVYDETRVSGGCWIFYYGYYTSSNTIGYDVGDYYISKKVKTAMTRYQILLTCTNGLLLPIYSGAYTTGTTKTLTTDAFDPQGQVYYYNTTTSISANGTPATGTLHTQSTYARVDIRYSFNTGSTLVSGSPIYIVCVPQSDGTAVLHSSPISQTLPSTNDGLLYKYIGTAIDTYRFALELCKPVFYHDGTGIRVWTGNSVNLSENVTYSQLVSKISANNGAGSLEPGKLYRITDYVTTTKNGENPDITSDSITYKSAMHQFDLIVTALSSNKLDCKAKAVQHDEDTYFSTSDLSKWQILYDINNDTNKYEWADSTNGKGVIYRMIDERNNDCLYDFKNILFKRKLTDGSYDPDNGTLTWVYTFGGTGDSSLTIFCFNNILKENIADSDDVTAIIYALPNNVFLGNYSSNNTFENYCSNNTFGENCYSNIFGENCYGNTFGAGCEGNTFGRYCSDNILGNYSSNNTFGRYCNDNTLEEGCSSNTFRERCNSNTFENNCSYNILGDYCNNNILRNNCQYNTFGIYCQYNTFGTYCNTNSLGNNVSRIILGNNCYRNIFGNTCQYNTLGNDCSNCTFGIYCSRITFGNSNNQYGNYIQYITIESGNQYIRLYNSSTANSSNYLQNICISQGVNSSTTYLDISTIARKLNYKTTVGRKTDGTLRIYNVADL